jgi:hypothetical protein
MVINLTGFESIVQASMPLIQTADVLRVPPSRGAAAIVGANMSADSLLVVLKHTSVFATVLLLCQTSLACLWPWLHACCVYGSA